MDDDFGFTFAKEESFSNPADAAKITELRDKNNMLRGNLAEVRNIITPLLKNLALNPDKEMIKWPNRKDVLEKLIKKLEDLTKV